MTGGAERAPAAAPILLELNKLEPTDGACSTYFVVRNDSDDDLASLRIDTYVFDPSGVIETRVALGFSDVGSRRMRVAPFLLQVPCERIGQILINDVLECLSPSGPREGCRQDIGVRSRSEADLVY